METVFTKPYLIHLNMNILTIYKNTLDTLLASPATIKECLTSLIKTQMKTYFIVLTDNYHRFDTYEQARIFCSKSVDKGVVPKHIKEYYSQSHNLITEYMIQSDVRLIVTKYHEGVSDEIRMV